MTMTPISQLKFYPGNARRGDIDLIAESLETLGQFKPIVVATGKQCPTIKNTILAGNHTVMAAQRLGWEHIDAHFIDVDETTARKIVLVDNKANDASSYDVEALTDLLREVDNLTGTGFTEEEFNNILEALEGTGDLEEPEHNPQTTEGYGLLVDCGDMAERETLRAELMARGFAVGDA